MGKRLILLLCLGSAIIAGTVKGLNESHATTWKALWTRLTLGSEDTKKINLFRVGLLDFANYTRISNSQPLLQTDQELESWLQRAVDDGLPLDNLDAVVSQIQESSPRYLKISVSAASGPTLDFVKDSLTDSLNKIAPEMTHLASVRRSTTGGMAHQVLLVTGRRLREFSPNLLHQTSDDAFYNVCPLCKSSHISRAMRHQESSSLECPSCHRTYAVIAADTSGHFHYVNHYLTGYQPPSIYPKGQSRVEQLFTIWSAVHQSCAYTRDPGVKKEKTDRWQTALQTQTRGMGDCEDSAILLADWLAARGYDVRVALGKYGDIGGHAWCVVRLEGIEYLLESTSEGRPDFDQPPLVSRIGSRYVPEVLFDRWHLYTRKTNHQNWNGDYWSPEQWTKITPPDTEVPEISAKIKPSASTNPSTTWAPPTPHSVQKDFFNSSDIAYTSRTDLQAAPFLHLEQTAGQPVAWQYPAAIPGSPGTVETKKKPKD
jgi:predicted transglutaminase-like cysteine proteinase